MNEKSICSSSFLIFTVMPVSKREKDFIREERAEVQ